MVEQNLNILAQKDGIVYKILQEKDIEQTIICLSEVFSGGEPMVKTLEITKEEFYPFAEIYCKKAIKEGLSVIATEKETCKVIGFVISEDFASEQPEGIESINEKFQPIMVLLDTLDEQYKKTHTVKKGQILHLFMGGVNENYKRNKVGITLTEENLKLAKTKQFSGAVAEATGLVSQHILRDKLGFEEMFSIEYKSFNYNGVNVFNNIEGPVSCILMEKRFYG